MDFERWLMEQVKRRDPVGDLARDAFAKQDGDVPRPKTGSGVRAWRKHLEHYGACDGAHRALDRAWKEYKSD